jgi:hypothetical protein
MITIFLNLLSLLHRIFVPSTNYNLDLFNHGDPTPGTPITLWWTWAGIHQTWKIESRMFVSLAVSFFHLIDGVARQLERINNSDVNT